MALVGIGLEYLPFLWPPVVNSNLLIDASGEKAAFVFRAPATGNITGIQFMTNTVTTGDTLLISLQDVNTSTGDPDETADQSVTQVVNSTDDNTRFAVTFGASRSVTIGDPLAVVFEFNSFVAGSINIRACANPSNIFNPRSNNSYCDLKTGGTWAKQPTMCGVCALNYGGTYYPTGAILPPTNTTVAFNNGSTPDEYALYFTPTAPMKVNGISALIDLDAAADLVLYDADGTTVLGSGSLNTNIRAQNNFAWTEMQFAEVTLNRGSTYRAAVKPTSASNISLSYVDVSAAAVLAQLGIGSGDCMSTRADAGAWTQTTTQRPAIVLMVTAQDDGTATGGGGAYILGC